MNFSLPIALNTAHKYKNISSVPINNFLRILIVEDPSPALILLPYHVRVSITALLLISLSIGSYFKFILYRFIFVSSKLNNGSYFNMSPINSMILNSAVIHHLTHLSTGLLLAMSIGTDIVPEKVFGSGYCKLIFLIGN